MTECERQIKDRPWLKIRRFAITNSLRTKLEAATDLTDKEKEYCCYIQNKILRETRKNPAFCANVGAKYWEDKMGGRYRRWIDLLVACGELKVNTNKQGKESYSTGIDGKEPFPKSYFVPFSALASGINKIDFKRKATALQDRTDWSQADDITRYLDGCCSRLTVPKALIDVTDPIKDAAAHEFSKRVFWGDFNIRYGDKGSRMYHSIIEMPKMARANLVWKKGGPPFFDYDIKSCHPVLLLPLFSDPLEREKYILILDHDVYSTIRTMMGVPLDRDEIKIQFMVCTNAIDRYVAERRGVAYQFFREHFPVFTREVLDLRSDLAVYLQQQEAQIMVQALGRFCMDRNFFWIPCHDGWLGIESEEGEIIKKVAEAFYRATGYLVRIEKVGFSNGVYNSTSILMGVGGVYGSYVRIAPTMPRSDYKKAAEEWFASVPKHPEPDAETLQEQQQAREIRKQAFRGHQRRGREAAELKRRLAPLAHRRWLEFKSNKEEQDAA
jgi:hypothetical protein